MAGPSPHPRTRVRIGAALATGSIALAALASAAPAATPTKGEQPVKSRPMTVGVVAFPITSQDARMMAAGGIRLARFKMNWAVAQPTERGRFDWRNYDTAVGALARRGLRAMPFLMKTTVQSGARVPTGAELGQWQQFVHAAVARYGSSGKFWRKHPALPYRPIRTWEVWNEPNLPRPGLSSATPPTDYEQLLAASAGVIRSTDPAAKLMAAGLGVGYGFGSIPAPEYLASLYRSGARRYFDLAGIHPYSSTVAGSEHEIAQMRSTMNDYGDASKPLWITEIGWGSAELIGDPLTVGMAAQARNTADFLSWLGANRRSLGITGLLWFDWRDPAGRMIVYGCVPCESMGLMNSDLTPKPAWFDFSRFALARAR